MLFLQCRHCFEFIEHDIWRGILTLALRKSVFLYTDGLVFCLKLFENQNVVLRRQHDVFREHLQGIMVNVNHRLHKVHIFLKKAIIFDTSKMLVMKIGFSSSSIDK